MSFSIHSIARNNIPASTDKRIRRAIAALQDANTFATARDVLLRFYYPSIRPLRDFSFIEENAFASFTRIVMRDKRGFDMSKFSLILEDAKREKEATPYERVGRVLSWLKEQKANNPCLSWQHSKLRSWMQSLLIDFTFHDALHNPGPMLKDPVLTFRGVKDKWAGNRKGLPWRQIWEVGAMSKGDDHNADELQEANKDYLHTKLSVRHQIMKDLPAAALLVFHEQSGILRSSRRTTWRDVGDYGILHPLLTQTEKNFRKEMWLDWLQYKGERWSSEDNHREFIQLQEDAFSAFKELNQMHWEVDPSNGNTYWMGARLQASPYISTPTKIDWPAVFESWSDNYPLLNHHPAVQELAKHLLDSNQYSSYLEHGKSRLGRHMLDLAIDLPSYTAPGSYSGMLHVKVHTLFGNPDKPDCLDLPHDVGLSL